MQIASGQRKLDDFDAKEMRELIVSRAFARIRQRLEAELERHRGMCERGEGVELQRAQGAAAAVRTALALPEQILKEITAALK